MKKRISFLLVGLIQFAVHNSFSTTVDTIPSAMVQGGMIHLNVEFTDLTTDTFATHVDAVTPQLKPFTLWKPGDDFNSSKPWYDELDPSQEARQFNSQYGFFLDVANSDSIPSGKSIGIRMTSSTSGLGSYFYNSSGSGTFDPVFLTTGATHDYVLWNGTMWHTVFTMPSTTPYGTMVNATFEFFLADTPANGFVDYTTTASAVSGYATTTQTLSWQAIPEPSVVSLVMGAAAWLLLRRKRFHSIDFGY